MDQRYGDAKLLACAKRWSGVESWRLQIGVESWGLQIGVES
jgi:hypothetical protein